MRWLISVAGVLLVAGCASQHSQQLSGCPKIDPGDYGYLLSGRFWFPPRPVFCGRVFERNVIAAVERRQEIRVSSIKCGRGDLGPLPLCFVRFANGRCGAWMVFPGAHRVAYELKAEPLAVCRHAGLA
jgi:hypothetical protein